MNKYKHIIIAGATRCGKTTLSLKLIKLGFNHYKMDTIKRGIYDNFLKRKTESWRVTSPKIASLINRIIKENDSDIVSDKERYVIDTCHLYPKDTKYIDLSNTLVIYLISSKLTIEEKMKKIRKYDKSNIFTYTLSDEELYEHIKLDNKYSKDILRECKKLNIKYFDVSDDFKKTIKEAYEYIKGVI